ncbi:MAG: hypothetical protein AAF378_08290 [Cyanobacteria bacterium P01_A01_bin.84]
MTWNTLGTYFVRKDWSFSKIVSGEIFRVKHYLSNHKNNEYLKGVIAPAFVDFKGTNIYNPKRFTYRKDIEIFTFYFPVGIEEQKIAFRRLDNSSAIWKIQIDLLESSQNENLVSYVINNYGDQLLMALQPRLYSGEAFPKSEDVELIKNQPKRVMTANTSRIGLTVRSASHPVILATKFDSEGQPLAVLEKMPPNYNFDFDGALAGYKGEVWAIAESDTEISYTEFSSEDKTVPPVA